MRILFAFAFVSIVLTGCAKPGAVVVDARPDTDVDRADVAGRDVTRDVQNATDDATRSDVDVAGVDVAGVDVAGADVAGADVAGADVTADDAGQGAPDVNGCGATECTCTDAAPAGGCVHTLGGLYENGACSGGYQCCDGSFREGLNVCGECTCQEVTGQEGCGQRQERCFPAFSHSTSVLSSELRAQMTPATWRAGCPVSLDDLRLLTMSHHTFGGEIAEGKMVVAAADAPAIVRIFEAMYNAEYPIASMRLMHNFNGDDDDSMEANNTSAFNCRQVTGGSSFSQHSFGNAIDINPVENPYVRGTRVLPPAGRAFTDRSDIRAGMIVSGDRVTAAFFAENWRWGGNFNSLKDYQHFSANGR